MRTTRSFAALGRPVLLLVFLAAAASAQILQPTEGTIEFASADDVQSLAELDYQRIESYAVGGVRDVNEFTLRVTHEGPGTGYVYIMAQAYFDREWEGYEAALEAFPVFADPTESTLPTIPGVLSTEASTGPEWPAVLSRFDPADFGPVTQSSPARAAGLGYGTARWFLDLISVSTAGRSDWAQPLLPATPTTWRTFSTCTLGNYFWSSSYSRAIGGDYATGTHVVSTKKLFEVLAARQLQTATAMNAFKSSPHFAAARNARAVRVGMQAWTFQGVPSVGWGQTAGIRITVSHPIVVNPLALAPFHGSGNVLWIPEVATPLGLQPNNLALVMTGHTVQPAGALFRQGVSGTVFAPITYFDPMDGWGFMFVPANADTGTVTWVEDVGNPYVPFHVPPATHWDGVGLPLEITDS